jgi:GPH family glycoside/pentoside/hexuronide:cation symporter
MESKTPSAKLQRRSIVIAGFGQNMVLTFVSTFMLMYLTQYARISKEGLIAVTAILAAAKVFDAINDPVMGVFVDKTRSRWGKLRPYILFSALPVAFFSAILFCIPNFSETGKLIFFAVNLVLWDLAYTACDVPYWGLIGAAFVDPERTKVISYVRAFGSIALGVVTLGAPWLAKLLSFSGGEATGAGWSAAAILIAIAGMAMFTLAFFNTRERHQPPADSVSLKTLFSTLIHNKPLYLVLLGSTLGFGRNIVQAGGAVFAIIAYNDEGYLTLIGAAIILGMVAASFLPHAAQKDTRKTPDDLQHARRGGGVHGDVFCGLCQPLRHDGDDPFNRHHARHLLRRSNHDDCGRGGQRREAHRRAQRRTFIFKPDVCEQAHGLAGGSGVRAHACGRGV